MADGKNCCSGERNPEETQTIPDCCRHKTKERSEKEYKDLVNRLSRVEGQIRGIRKMLLQKLMK